ncbi:hypothetical protein JJQ58_08125 [Mammaliicoccus fleurettii]|uniref:DUF5780 domain-containing protein n=1 Tax=Mammaliicoccus fleurettii TaxID=150056 RepID=A0ABS5MPW2_9STAP|nr:DUF5780 domain-containing protein [Mammaliicoccus fleurettii]MBL0847745.1 hypothetical protein [Mammaliicoccus fleurettii]MBS3697431.1 hypothetical protein [Mammaliicoccus fleurettii]MEB7805739.1 DUF5780 domain-containing protein [Mammaliicoccus fleurettii]
MKKALIIIFAVLYLYGCENKGSNADSSESTAEDMTESKVKREHKSMNANSLENNLDKQDLVIEDGKYLIRSEDAKSLYPDALQAFIRNNTYKDIKDITFGFVAWDKNGLPVKIKQSIDFSDGEESGMEIKEGIDVEFFKPIVVSYEDFEGNTWENKELKNFLKVYEGKRLKDIVGYENHVYNKNN